MTKQTQHHFVNKTTFLKSGAGFTLIELLVVIAIIGILSGVILINLISSRAKARDAKRMEDMHQILIGLELYRSDCDQYPPTLDLVEATGCPGTVTLADFFSAIPVDPTPGNSYVYTYDNTDNTFAVDFTLEGNVNQYAVGAHTLTQDGIQ